jgi:hypothetical protein
MAHGLAKRQKLRPFVVRILYFSSKPISLQKHAIIGFAHATPSEDQLYIIPASTDTKQIRDNDKSVFRKLDDEWMHEVNLNHLEVETQQRIKSLLWKHASVEVSTGRNINNQTPNRLTK